MTDRYAVIGNPIAHSKSPAIHAAFARQTGQDLTYEAILGPLDGFVACVRQFMRDGGKGMNVTVPFKIQAVELADRLTERARHAQAVNTLKFEADGSILGDNTDGVGMVRDIRDVLGVPIAGRRVLLLGAGGAARGVLLPLLEEGPAGLVIANRTPEKAEQLKALCPGRGEVDVARFDELGGQGFDVVINATSASLGGEGIALPAGIYGAGALAYDMVYGDRPTPFMLQAREQGAARVSDGLGMLVGQAAESFYLWRRVRPDTAPVIAMLRAC
ncbi:shikimate dehydrogenase [Thauera sinica]|uniref:Shikimate dehydrogenase (NADP(+)) n=1 Tax=Thauera sinica TaxID=2665146 RepID=A0ABW1ATR2_9RHOO|nr:shikimate dehydrogenase [Thauera sp. K11]ATE58811.1 shikimate dehydrogenase [Thauera sp. K11]